MSDFWSIVQAEQDEAFCWWVRDGDGGLVRVHHRGDEAQEIDGAAMRRQTQ